MSGAARVVEQELNTFSVAARCPQSGMLGVVVATAVPAVGSNCPYVAGDAGAIATQAWVNPYLGIDGLRLLRTGLPAADVARMVLADDPRADSRQLGIVDRDGRSAAHTGAACSGWCGHHTAPDLAIQGNMLAGEAVIDAMAAAMAAAPELPLPERLLRALEAGDAHGGDCRGKQSAALHVVAGEEYAHLDLRVDEHPEPVRELRRVFAVAARQLLPFAASFPTRTDPAGAYDADTWAMLERGPDARDGGRGPS
jgi:uncharacterized Ntn-hydrolase superfamily protein